MTNALKYAFPDNEAGVIKVSLQKVDKQLKLSVSDDGIGLPDDYKSENSFGDKHITALNERLEGTMSQSSIDGTHINICFTEFKISS